MTWWEITILALVAIVSICGGGLMGAWAAERRLDRRLERGLAPPRLNPQKAQDAGEATDG